MSRRHRADKRLITPDPKYHNEVVAKFMNSVMYEGKKSVAEHERLGRNRPLEPGKRKIRARGKLRP